MRRFALLLLVVLGPAAAVAACASDATTAVDDGDAGDDAAATSKTDAKPTTTPEAGDDDSGGDAGSAIDANCPKPKTIPDAGETCTGFGAKSPCDTACGLPAYGYVCFNGGPPGFTGCVQVSATSFGDTYCCPKDDCVAEPDQDTQCNGTGKPHLYQCPPAPSTGAGDAGFATPPAGCVAKPMGLPYPYYCCP